MNYSRENINGDEMTDIELMIAEKAKELNELCIQNNVPHFGFFNNNSRCFFSICHANTGENSAQRTMGNLVSFMDHFIRTYSHNQLGVVPLKDNL